MLLHRTGSIDRDELFDRFSKIRVTKACFLKKHKAQTKRKIPEKPSTKPLFGDSSLELLT